MILSTMRSETSLPEAVREHGLTLAEVEDWWEKSLTAAENALATKPRDEQALNDQQTKKLK